MLRLEHMYHMPWYTFITECSWASDLENGPGRCAGRCRRWRPSRPCSRPPAGRGGARGRRRGTSCWCGPVRTTARIVRGIKGEGSGLRLCGASTWDSTVIVDCQRSGSRSPRASGPVSIEVRDVVAREFGPVVLIPARVQNHDAPSRDSSPTGTRAEPLLSPRAASMADWPLF